LENELTKNATLSYKMIIGRPWAGRVHVVHNPGRTINKCVEPNPTQLTNGLTQSDPTRPGPVRCPPLLSNMRRTRTLILQAKESVYASHEQNAEVKQICHQEKGHWSRPNGRERGRVAVISPAQMPSRFAISHFRCHSTSCTINRDD